MASSSARIFRFFLLLEVKLKFVVVCLRTSMMKKVSYPILSLAMLTGLVECTTPVPTVPAKPEAIRSLRGKGWVTTSSVTHYFNRINADDKGTTVVHFDIFANPPIYPEGMSAEDFEGIHEEHDLFDLS